MTGALERAVREGLEDVQFLSQLLRLWVSDVRSGRADRLLEEHWWRRVSEAPEILSSVFKRVERLFGKQKRRRARRARVAVRARVLQFELPL